MTAIPPTIASAFENEGRESRLGEIERGDESVVSAADNDYALAFTRHQIFPRFQSERIFRAAFSPGAPMIPPPGCVAEPHM